MSADVVALRIVSTAPAALGAWALAALAVWVLRIRDPRLRGAVWTFAAIDTLLALAGWNGAGLLVVRLVAGHEFMQRWVMPWASPMLATWAVVASALVVRRVVATARAARAAATLHQLHGATVASVPEDVRLALPPGDGTPFVAGIVRPVVVVPRATWDRLDAEERAAVVGHEAAHVRGFDSARRLVAAIVTDVLWFALPLRWIVARMDEETELAADAAAVRGGASPHALARAVVATIAGLGAPRGSLAFRGSGGPLVRRLEALRRPARRRVVAAQVVALLVLTPWAPGAGGAVVVPGDGARGAVALGLQWSANPVQRMLLESVRAR